MARSLPSAKKQRRLVTHAALGVSLAALVWLGWQIIGNTVADSSAVLDPDAALTWRPSNAEALEATAVRLLTDGTNAAALSDARKAAESALIARPIDGAPLRILGTVADLEGDVERADKLMSAASMRSLRDTGAHVWLFNRRAQEGHFAEAAQHIDVILRTRPDLLDRLTPALMSLADNADARPYLAQSLGAHPPWRRAFFTRLAQADENNVSPYAVLVALAQVSDGVQPADLKPYLDRLITADQFEKAFLVWAQFLPKATGLTLPFLFNGDFEQPVSNLAFDWSVSQTAGAITEVVDSGDAERGKVLRVAFSGRRVPYAHVSKLLVLPPGTYELDGLVKADHLDNARGMSWHIYCADGGDKTLALGEPSKGTHDWSGFKMGFTVPPNDCHAEWLRLELASTLAIEQQISGVVLYDQLVVHRLSDDNEFIAAQNADD